MEYDDFEQTPVSKKSNTWCLKHQVLLHHVNIIHVLQIKNKKST